VELAEEVVADDDDEELPIKSLLITTESMKSAIAQDIHSKEFLP
jgi:hypothetical protein